MTASGRAAGGGERGAVMMFILMMMGLVGVVTTGVMLLIAADLSAGIRQLHAVRVFNIAEAGVHYAIGRLQSTGATYYAGETISVSDGSTVLGSATVTVSCLDGSALPCSGTYAPYRRIVSTGTLPTSGPTRTVVAVVEGYPYGLTGYAICAYNQVLVNQGISVYGDVGSNGTIDLLGPASNYSRILADPSPNGYYDGNARAVGAVNCSQGCPTQVQGTTTPYAPGPVCPAVTMPPFSPGTTDKTIASPTTSWTMDATTGYDWQDITVNAAGASGGCESGYRDLIIQTGASGTTTIVNVRRLRMERCTRLIVAGEGRVDLRVAELTAQGVYLGQYGRLGVLPTDTLASPQYLPAGRLSAWVRSSAMDPAAVQIDRASIVSGAWVVPNGEYDLDRLAGAVGNVYGGVLTFRADIDRDFIFTYTETDTMLNLTYSNFNRLRSWKDQ